MIALAGHAPKVGHNGLDCSIELKLRGMLGYMGRCVVPVFEAIRDPVYKIF